MFFLKLLGKLIKVLGSQTSPNRIAWGFALGAVLGLTPLWSLHNLVVVVLFLLLNVNISSALLAFILYSFFAWALDPLFHTIGFSILVQISFMKPLWTTLYNAPFVPFTRFNNTVVMGSFIFSLLLFIPNFLVFRWLVIRYRSSWRDAVQRMRILKILQGNSVVQFYLKVKKLGG